MKNLILVVALFIISMNVKAQWTSNTDINTEVSNYTNENMDIKSVALDNGRTAVVFWKVVSTGENYVLMIQIIDANGNKELGDEGQLISNTIPMSTYTNTWTLVTDNSSNIYVGITGTDGAAGIVFKLDNHANYLWPSDGVSLGSGYSVTILPLEDGNTLVSWMGGDYTSYIQKYDSNGDAVWAENLLTDPTGSTVPAALFELSNGDFVSIYHQVVGYGINSNLYSNRYTANGEYVWANPVQISTKTTVFNTLYSPAQSADTLFFGYVGKANDRFDSHIQRINPDGTLPWGENGLDFDVNETDYEMDTRIAIEEGSEFLWAICTYSNTEQSEQGESVQKFNITEGTRLFTDNAKNLYPIGSEYTHNDKLFVYDDQAFFILKKGADDGVSETLLDVVSLDANGDFVWTEESKPIASNIGTNKGQVQLNEAFNGQSVIVFAENKGTGTNIYAQKFIEESTGIREEKEMIATKVVYTNPVKNNLYVQSESEIKNIKIVDITGRVVFIQNNILSKKINLNTSEWNKGLYILFINSDESYKIIKE